MKNIFQELSDLFHGHDQPHNLHDHVSATDATDAHHEFVIDDIKMEDLSVDTHHGFEYPVLAAIDRMTDHVNGTNVDDISHYLQNFDDVESLQGIVNNTKGIYSEIEAVNSLNEHSILTGSDIHYVLPASTNYESIDIFGIKDGEIVEKIQVKMTDNPDYIQEALEKIPEDVKIICPSSMIKEFHDTEWEDRFIDLGLDNGVITERVESVVDTLAHGDSLSHGLFNDAEFSTLDSMKTNLFE